MTNHELTYWVTLALMPKIWTRRKNDIYIKCYTHSPRISIVDLFEDASIWDEIGLTQEEMLILNWLIIRSLWKIYCLKGMTSCQFIAMITLRCLRKT